MGPISPLDILYGHSASMQSGNLFMAHRCGFTKKSLSRTFITNGFHVGVKARPNVFDLWAVAVKDSTSIELLTKIIQHFSDYF